MHDHVTVGAGSCGAALAARLSGDPGTSVLLLGAGSDYRSADAPPAMQLLNPFANLDDPTHGRFSDEGLVARRSVAEEP